MIFLFHLNNYQIPIRWNSHSPLRPTYRIIMRPHDVCRWFRGVPHNARQIDRGPGVDVHVRAANNRRNRLHDRQVHEYPDGRRR